MQLSFPSGNLFFFDLFFLFSAALLITFLNLMFLLIMFYNGCQPVLWGKCFKNKENGRRWVCTRTTTPLINITDSRTLPRYSICRRWRSHCQGPDAAGLGDVFHPCPEKSPVACPWGEAGEKAGTQATPSSVPWAIQACSPLACLSVKKFSSHNLQG